MKRTRKVFKNGTPVLVRGFDILLQTPETVWYHVPMPKDFGYGDMDFEYGDTPYVASSNKNKAPVNTQGERFAETGIDFVYRNEESYNELAGNYEQAWIAYFEIETHDENGNAIPFNMPAYSEENAQKLQDVIKFALFMESEEEINVELEPGGSPTRGYGVWSEGEEVRQDSPRMSPYATQNGTYETLETFYNQDLYDAQTDDGQDPLPTLKYSDEKVMLTGDELSDMPHMAEVWSAEYRNGAEYESTKGRPKTQWEWGGPYATGKTSYQG